MTNKVNIKNNYLYTKIIQENVVLTEGEHCTWGRLICRWTEKNNGQLIKHIYAACINLNDGDIYLDCSKKKIWTKFCSFLVIQPLNLSLKTIYHLALPLSLPLEVYLGVSAAKKANPKATKLELGQVGLVQAYNNVADILRTPMYGIALITIGIAAVIIGPLAPKKLYDFRATAAKVERALNHDNKYGFWVIYRCFQPVSNLTTIYKWNRDKIFDDTIYAPKLETSLTLMGMTHFSRSVIRERQRVRHPFNDCFRLSPLGKPYRSITAPSNLPFAV